MPKYVIRYGAMRTLGVMTVRGNDRYERAAQVVIRTERGLETGEVLCVATDETMDHLSHAAHGQVLRLMTSEDDNEWAHIQSQTRHEFEICKRHVRELGLAMDLVDLERLFGGERLIIYYLSEDRVDFRELVKRLAGEFQTRIEMRQIGIRDEAKLLADYGDCGKPVCCNTHLSAMPPVSMKMAKLQKATLDPTKISGRCGRLKCCLRYEYDTYVELQRELPPPGSDVVTREGRARVLNQSILAQQLLVEMEDMRRVLIHATDVLTVLRRGGGKSAPKKAPSKPESTSGGSGSGGGARGGGSSGRSRSRPRPNQEAADEGPNAADDSNDDTNEE